MLERMMGFAKVQTTTHMKADGRVKCRGCKELRPVEEFEIGRAHSPWAHGRTGTFQTFVHVYCAGCLASLDDGRKALTKPQRRYLNSLFHKMVAGCNRRSRCIPIFISLADVERLYVGQKGKCAISGVDLGYEMGPNDGRKRWANASIDRISSVEPYHLGNCHLVTVAVNLMKSEMTLEELGYWCTQVVLHGLEGPTA